MMMTSWMRSCVLAAAWLTASGVAQANDYREKGKVVDVGNSTLTVTPPRDWNRLKGRPGKFAETWTLDGEQLNDVTFFAGVEPGQPLLRERNRKRDPLPKFTSGTLLVEIPELLAGTYRTYRKIGAFSITNVQPDQFLALPGVRFSYEYTDEDNLPRKGESRAALVGGKLYMVTFDAPRLHYYDRTLNDYRALAATATLGN